MVDFNRLLLYYEQECSKQLTHVLGQALILLHVTWKKLGMRCAFYRVAISIKIATSVNCA